MGDVLLWSAHATAPNSHAVLHPEWAPRLERRSTAGHLRSLSGRAQALRWAAATRLVLRLRYVPSGTRDFVHGLWSARVPVAVTLDSSHGPSTVLGVLANVGSPLPEQDLPYADRWRGELILEARDGAPAGGQPLLLDDAAQGLLDEAPLALG